MCALAQGDAFDGEAVGKAADDITMASRQERIHLSTFILTPNLDVAAKIINWWYSR